MCGGSLSRVMLDLIHSFPENKTQEILVQCPMKLLNLFLSMADIMEG